MDMKQTTIISTLWLRLIAGGLLLWFLAANKLFIGTVLDFVLAGKLPFGGVVVSPDVVVAGCAAAIVVTLVAGMALVRKVPAGYEIPAYDAVSVDTTSPVVQHTYAAPVQPVYSPQPAPLEETIYIPDYVRPQVGALPYRNEPLGIKLHIACMQGVMRAREVSGEIALRQENRLLWHAGRMKRIMDGLRELFLTASDALLVASEVAMIYALQAWTAAEPHLYRLDDWLEEQVKAAQKSLYARVRRSEAATLITEALAEPLRSFREVSRRS